MWTEFNGNCCFAALSIRCTDKIHVRKHNGTKPFGVDRLYKCCCLKTEWMTKARLFHTGEAIPISLQFDLIPFTWHTHTTHLYAHKKGANPVSLYSRRPSFYFFFYYCQYSFAICWRKALPRALLGWPCRVCMCVGVRWHAWASWCHFITHTKLSEKGARVYWAIPSIRHWMFNVLSIVIVHVLL